MVCNSVEYPVVFLWISDNISDSEKPAEYRIFFGYVLHRWQKWMLKNWDYFLSFCFSRESKKPELEHYWSKRQISTPIFAKVIGRNRFLLLKKFLHFTNNKEFDKDRHPRPKLNKIYELMKHFHLKFREVYIPGKNLSLDESFMQFKGRLQ